MKFSALGSADSFQFQNNDINIDFISENQKQILSSVIS